MPLPRVLLLARSYRTCLPLWRLAASCPFQELEKVAHLILRTLYLGCWAPHRWNGQDHFYREDLLIEVFTIILYILHCIVPDLLKVVCYHVFSSFIDFAKERGCLLYLL